MLRRRSLLLLGSGALYAGPLEDRIRRIEQRWAPSAAMATTQVPAVSVAVFRDGQIEWARAYGVATSTGTLFQAASISKPVAAMAALGFKPFLDPAVQAPIIVTFHAPADARYDFRTFYAAARRRGFLLYPGKLTTLETFRVGCIGAIGPTEIEQAVHAVALALQDMGIASGAPARS